MKDTLEAALEFYYEQMESNADHEAYHLRHGTQSASILTCYTDEKCADIAAYLEDRISGKVVVEIGAGIGLLACYVAQYARKVYAIECDPCWANTFSTLLWKKKPKNLTFIWGMAEDAPPIAADVAYFCTLSGRPAMHHAATLFAPVVIDVYAEIMKDNPVYRERQQFMKNMSDITEQDLVDLRKVKT